MATITRLFRQGLTQAIKLYQLVVSPYLPQSCRFYPSCSHYAVAAISRHGPVRGGWYTFRRLLRCHPWHEGGIDEVPELVQSETKR